MKNCHIHKACVLLVMGMFMLLPFTSKAQRQVQTLGRGVVVAKNGSNALITWRRLAQEPEQARWNIYVNGTKLKLLRAEDHFFYFDVPLEGTVTLMAEAQDEAGIKYRGAPGKRFGFHGRPALNDSL